MRYHRKQIWDIQENNKFAAVIYNVQAHIFKSEMNIILFCIMALFQPSNCNMVSLKEHFKKRCMMQGASRKVGYHDLYPSLSLLCFYFPLQIKSVQLACQLFENMDLQHYSSSYVPVSNSYLTQVLDILFELLFQLGLFGIQPFSTPHIFLFLFLLHAATPNLNFHSSSSTPKYFLSLNLYKTSLQLFVRKYNSM